MGIDVLSFVLGKAASGGNGNGGAVLENLPISLDFTNGNQTITAPDGYVVKSATIEKPSDLIAENIRKDKNIAGVVGTMEMPEIVENVPIELDFSNGKQEQKVAAPDGYAVKSIKIQKPAALIPENIAEGVEIAGVVGTHVGGGGSDDSTEPKYIEDSWATISAHSLAGEAQEYYRVGDFKGVAINNSSGYPEIYLAVIAGFNLHCNTSGGKDGITFIVKGLPKYDTVSSTSDTKIYTVPAVETLLYSKIANETKKVIRQSVVGDYIYDDSSDVGVVEKDTTCRLFCPLLSNISDSLTGIDGTDVIKNNTILGTNWFEGTEYESTKDSGVFPLFSDMSKEQIKTFFGITGNKMLTTRTLVQMLAAGGLIHTNRIAAIKASEDYVLYKDCFMTGSRYFTFCFRV